MNRSVCNFIAILNQAIKKKAYSFRCSYFSLAFPILDALVREGFLQYYTRKGEILQVVLRCNKNGPILSGVTSKSKPSKRVFVRWRELKPKNTIKLLLCGSHVLTATEAFNQKRGGIVILEIV